MAFRTRSAIRSMLAATAFLAYAAAVLLMHSEHKSTWELEHEGGIVFAASYLFYDQPFGSIGTGLWDRVRNRLSLRNMSNEEAPELFLSDAAQRKVPFGTTKPTTLDGTGLGYPFLLRLRCFYSVPILFRWSWHLLLYSAHQYRFFWRVSGTTGPCR